MVASNAKAAARTKRLATLAASCLVNSAWANQLLAEWNGLELVQNGEQALTVPQRQTLDLKLEDRVIDLRALLLLLLGSGNHLLGKPRKAGQSLWRSVRRPGSSDPIDPESHSRACPLRWRRHRLGMNRADQHQLLLTHQGCTDRRHRQSWRSLPMW